MSDSCTCESDCDCSDKIDRKNISPEEKVENLKKAIADLGFSVEETGEGEIKISEKNF